MFESETFAISEMKHFRSFVSRDETPRDKMGQSQDISSVCFETLTFFFKILQFPDENKRHSSLFLSRVSSPFSLDRNETKNGRKNLEEGTKSDFYFSFRL